MTDRIAELEARIFDALDDIPEALALAELVEIARGNAGSLNDVMSRDLLAALDAEREARRNALAFIEVLEDQISQVEDRVETAEAALVEAREALIRWHRSSGDCECLEPGFVNLCETCSADIALRELAAALASASEGETA